MRRMPHPSAVLAVALCLGLVPRPAPAASCTVPTSPGCTTIQAAIDQANPGDTITVREKDGSNTPYFEKLSLSTSGISLVADAGHAPILDGTGVVGQDMILLDGSGGGLDDVTVQGFEIRNHLGVDDGSGIRFIGSGDGVRILDNVIHDIRGQHAMGITVYATMASPISGLVIDGNTIRDCDPANSEALALNGNVDGFRVSNNVVRDVNNIGIVCIGGETNIQPNANLVCRNGVIRGNTVERANSNYGGGYAGGIYVDGGTDVVIENNVVTGCDIGIEVGAENAGRVAQNVVVRNNVIHHNEKAGLAFGGYASNVGRASNNTFSGNTLYKNNTLGPDGVGRYFSGNGVGEIWVQFGANNRLVHNLVYAGSPDVFIASYEPGENPPNVFDYNLYFSETNGLTDGAFGDHGTFHTGLASWQAGSGQDAHSIGADPLLADPGQGDFHIDAASPAVDAGDPAFVADPNEVDLDGQPRLLGARVDIGADEGTCGNGSTEAGEACDDGNTANCDGCDNNCTLSATCGNGIVCNAEQCDDGNIDGGDCCSATCGFEPAASSCDDGQSCTRSDVCDGAGVCAGDRIGGPGCALADDLRGCHEALAKASKLYLKARLKAVQSCRNALNKGKDLYFANGTPLLDPADCALEARGLAKTAKAAGKARDLVAKPRAPKCTDSRLAELEACAVSVDGVVAPGGSGGCLLSAIDDAVDAITDDAYGDALSGTEPNYNDQRRCQETLAKAGAGLVESRLKQLQSCRNRLHRGFALRFPGGAPLVDPNDCAAGDGFAAKLAQTAQKTRAKIATACDDPTLSDLTTVCAMTLDGVIDASGSGGCLPVGHNGRVDAILAGYD